MPKDNGKRDTQRTETGYEIPVPKRDDVFGILEKAATKKPPEKPSRSEPMKAPGTSPCESSWRVTRDRGGHVRIS